MSPVNADQCENFLLAHAPEFVEGATAADAELTAGETTSLAEARRQLEDAS
jgi:hypothetical protein